MTLLSIIKLLAYLAGGLAGLMIFAFLAYALAILIMIISDLITKIDK